MAGIQTSIKLNDQMTATLRRIEGSLDKLISKMGNLEKSVSRTMNNMSQSTNKAAINEQRLASQTLRTQINAEKLNREKIKTKQLIDKANSSQSRFNRTMSQGVSIASTLGNAIKVGLGAYLGTQAISNTIGLADTMQMTRNRLDLLNDGLQTTDELENKIYESAMRSRAGFLESADAVAKLGLRTGKVFDNMDEVIAFNETLNKMFVIAGTGEHERYSATLQLTQALGSGVLRGQEFIAVSEAAPNVMQAVADYMDVPIGKLKDMGAEGEVTADIVKNAMFKAAEQTNEKFKKMSYTFGHIWTGIKNSAIKAFRPVLKQISSITSSPRWIKLIDGIGIAIGKIANWTSKLFDELSKSIPRAFDWVESNWGTIEGVFTTLFDLLNDIYNAAKWVAEMFIKNWSLIEPIVWGIVWAIAAMKAELAWGAIVGFATKLKGIFETIYLFCSYLTGSGLVTAFKALGLSAIASWGLAIVAVVAGLWFIVRLIGKAFGVTISFFGFLCAMFASLWVMIWNTGAISWNICMYIVAILATVVNVILSLVWNLIALILNMISAAVQFIIISVHACGAFILACLWDVAAVILNVIWMVGQFVVNCFVWLCDNAGIICDNIGIYFQNLGTTMKAAFYDAISACIKWLASLINKLSGIPLIGDKFKGAADSLSNIGKGFKDSAKSIRATKKEYKSLKSFGSIDTETFKYKNPTKVADKVINSYGGIDTETYKYANPVDVGKYTWNTLDKSLPMASLKGSDTVIKAYKWGDKFKLSDLFGGSKNDLKDFDYEKVISKFKEDALQQSLIPTAQDYTKIPTSGKNGSGAGGSGYTPISDAGKYANGGFGDNPALQGILENTKDIANNTSVKADDEDLSYMRDMATRQAIDRHTTRNVKIEMSNSNNFNNGMDFDTFLKQLYKTVAESVNSSASGVHY